jgi:hypothetical protein
MLVVWAIVAKREAARAKKEEAKAWRIDRGSVRSTSAQDDE